MESSATQSTILDSRRPYIFKQVLKHSGTGFIYIIEPKNAVEPLVLKIIPLGHKLDPTFEEQKKNAEEEYGNMLLLATHPGFVKPIDGMYYENSDHGYFDILMEHCGRSLSDLKFEKATSLEARVDWIKQCAEAMAFAESKSIYHGDIKPQNLMLKGGKILKLIDLGGSRSMGTTTYAKTIIQVTKKVKELTPCYAALELLEGRDPIIMNKLDVYAFAKTFYEICYNKTPKELDQERMKLCVNDASSRFLRTNEDEYNIWLQDLITRILPDDIELRFSKIVNQVLYMCLQYKPERRPSFAEIRAFLQLELHPASVLQSECEEGNSEIDIPPTVKYKGKEKPEDEDLKVNEVYYNPYENVSKIINFYSDLKCGMIIDLEGEGPIEYKKKIYGAFLHKDAPSMPSMAQSIMTDNNRYFLLGGKYETLYSEAIFELFLVENEETKSTKDKKKRENIGPQIKAEIKKGVLKIPRILFGLIYSKNRLYLLAGNAIGNKLLKECELYNIIDDTIQSIPPLSERKEAVSACTYQDRWIYVFGGRFQNYALGSDMLDNFSNLIELYDMEKNIWQQVDVSKGLNEKDIINIRTIYRGSASSGSCQMQINRVILFGGIMWKRQEDEPKPTNISLMFEALAYTVKAKEFTKQINKTLPVMATDYIGSVYCVKGHVFAFNSVYNSKCEPTLFYYNSMANEWKAYYFTNQK